MDIGSVPPLNTTKTQAEGTENRSVLNSDFEVFLKMLTAQALYQDPLEPVSSSEYAAQLAQFSMVEQQVLTNELMENLVQASGATSEFNPPTWLGLEVLAETPVSYSGQPIELAANPPLSTTEMALVVYDNKGDLVLDQQVTIASGPVVWNGINDDKKRVEDGFYTVRVESRRGDEVIQTDTIEAYRTVTETLLEDGEVVLLLDNGATVKADQVTGMRDPDLASGSDPVS